MPVRLLSKSDLAKAKTDAQRASVDEGVKIARRVDRLREVAAEEEASLERFRKERLKQIHEETSEAIKERDGLRSEVAELKKRREDLLRPIDKERRDAEDAIEALKEKEVVLARREAIVEESERRTEEASRQADAILEGAHRKDAASDERLQNAERANREAETVIDNARKMESEVLRIKSELELEFVRRDMELAARERDCEMREQSVRDSEGTLKKEWKLLKDRKAMFSRTITRNKK